MKHWILSIGGEKDIFQGVAMSLLPENSRNIAGVEKGFFY
jgi:hypothetical protein